MTDHAGSEIARIRGRLRDARAQQVADEDLLASPHVFVGSAAGIADHIRALRDRFGISSFTFDPAPDTDRIVERLAGT